MIDMKDGRLEDRLSLMLESMPDTLVSSTRCIRKDQRLLSRFSYDGEEYTLRMAIEDNEMPTYILAGKGAVPQELISSLTPQLGRPEPRRTARSPYVFKPLGIVLPSVRKIEDIDYYRLYSSLGDLVPGTADGTSLRFTDEQVYWAFTKQGLLKRDHGKALQFALDNKYLVQHEDGFGVDANKLTMYNLKLHHM